MLSGENSSLGEARLSVPVSVIGIALMHIVVAAERYVGKMFAHGKTLAQRTVYLRAVIRDVFYVFLIHTARPFFRKC